MDTKKDSQGSIQMHLPDDFACMTTDYLVNCHCDFIHAYFEPPMIPLSSVVVIVVDVIVVVVVVVVTVVIFVAVVAFNAVPSVVVSFFVAVVDLWILSTLLCAFMDFFATKGGQIGEANKNFTSY